MAKKILPIIVLAQFACTSVWFAGNAIVPDLVTNFGYPAASVSYVSSAVQLGFIIGTLVFAVFTISDRMSPSLVFFLSAVAAAFCNSSIIFGADDFALLLLMRFLTGFFLAGIYPVGMKIASDYFDRGLGPALGFLVGALVVGTAFPHLLNSFSVSANWKAVLLSTSAMSLAGGMLIWLLVPDGPYRSASQQLELTAFFKVFQDSSFRAASFGYFGHMWELYAFWAFTPLAVTAYAQQQAVNGLPVSLISFAVIGIGGLACVIGGLLSRGQGVKRIAALSLFLSACCCLLSPLAFELPLPLFITFMLFWGMVVIADSPLFSTLVAKSAPVEKKGTALTIATCIGFAVTIVSIQLLNFLDVRMSTRFIFLFLLPGPVFGLLALRKDKKSK